jgi:hypothetical protein
MWLVLAGDEPGLATALFCVAAATDWLEARRQPEALQRRRHPRRHDPAHSSALEHQRDPVPVAPRARLRPGPEPLAQHLRDGSKGASIALRR